jgi:hypothetical protein
MKNGTSRAVLVAELLSADGPYVTIADDFVMGRCSRCAHEVDDDVVFVPDGFYCGECARSVRS